MAVSIANLSAGQAKSYYDKDDLDCTQNLKDEDRYAAHWHGKGAAELRLHGAIDPQQFQQVLQGISLEGKWLHNKPIDPENHRAGTDITVSAPKSVSLAALVQNDRRLVMAHDRAVQTVLDVAEARYMQARRWNAEAGKQEKVLTGNLASATFRHVTSRNHDAQLHSHCVTLNSTQDAERWKAVSNELIAQNQRPLDRIYMNDLAHEAQQLGYPIKRKAGARFELGGYSQEALRAFSSRRVEIEQAVSASGDQPNARNFQKHTLHTRAKKRSTSDQERREKWDRVLEEYQIKLPSIPQARELERTDAEQMVQEHIARLTAQQSAFTREELERSILEADLGRCKFVEIAQAIDHAPQLVQYADLLTTSAYAQWLTQLETLLGLDDAPHQTRQTEAIGRTAESQTDRDCAGSIGSRIAERLAATLSTDRRSAAATHRTTAADFKLDFSPSDSARTIDPIRTAVSYPNDFHPGAKRQQSGNRAADPIRDSSAKGIVRAGNQRSHRHFEPPHLGSRRRDRPKATAGRAFNFLFSRAESQSSRNDTADFDFKLRQIDRQLADLSQKRAELKRQEAEQRRSAPKFLFGDIERKRRHLPEPVQQPPQSEQTESQVTWENYKAFLQPLQPEQIPTQLPEPQHEPNPTNSHPAFDELARSMEELKRVFRIEDPQTLPQPLSQEEIDSGLLPSFDPLRQEFQPDFMQQVEAEPEPEPQTDPLIEQRFDEIFFTAVEYIAELKRKKNQTVKLEDGTLQYRGQCYWGEWNRAEQRLDYFDPVDNRLLFAARRTDKKTDTWEILEIGNIQQQDVERHTEIQSAVDEYQRKRAKQKDQGWGR